ncbi:MAG: GreA/GreB family elongation factor [Verrucomicrobiota bacterium]
MKEEFEKLVASGKISRHHLEALLELTRAGYCMHRSWGFGKITTVDTVFCRFSIDFQGKPGHSMDLAFAAESLKPIPKDHILARKASDLGALRQMAALHHLDLIKLVLQSYGGKATLEQIQQVLVPDVITEDWKKWWEVAKRELKKDGHFQVPMKKSDPIIYQVSEVSLQNRLLGDFRAAKGLKARLAVANEILKNLADLTDQNAAANEVIQLLNADIQSHQRTMAGLALEAIFLRDELRHAAGLPAGTGELTDLDIWTQTPKPAPLLETLPAAKHKRALQSFRAASPEHWAEVLIAALNSMSTKLCSECAALLISEGKLEMLKDHLARLISQHQASSELLLWLAKERSDTFADILGPEVFRAMLTAIERDQFKTEKKTSKLGDFILQDPNLLVELLSSADLEVIKDVTRALQLSPCFDDMDKRSLLARIVKSYPAMQALISGEQTKQDSTFIVSWESLERRKQEYNELVQKKIPANSKEIAIARSYGDLRENHEYKAAKEMQKLLMRRKGELETQLVRARGTDFSNARKDVVGVGTKVNVVDLENQHHESFTILGAWDSDPERGIISYLTPIAQALMNSKPGDEAEFESHGVKKRFRIESIELVQAPAAAPAQPAATPAPAAASDAVSEPAPAENAGSSPAPEASSETSPSPSPTT